MEIAPPQRRRLSREYSQKEFQKVKLGNVKLTDLLACVANLLEQLY